MDRWTGRVAIVTGASSGIGAAIAHLLAENGMRVVAVARRAQKLQSLAGELKGCKGELHAIQCDVTKEDDVIRVVKWARHTLGGADVLVNNAGVAPSCPFASCETEKIKQILETNILGLCMFTREVIKDMRDRKVDDGHIFQISSVSGQRIIELPGIYVYAGSKHAVRVMTEGLRRELRDMGTKIRVTSISPGLVSTEIFAASGASAETVEELLGTNSHLRPRDIAEALLYALRTPPHVQVHEITIEPVGENF